MVQERRGGEEHGAEHDRKIGRLRAPGRPGDLRDRFAIGGKANEKDSAAFGLFWQVIWPP